MTLIDLGVPGDYRPEPPPPPRWARKLGIPVGRKVAAFLALALLGGGLAGTAPATVAGPQLRIIPALDTEGSFWMIDDVLVQLQNGVRTVSATDLDSGRVLWTKAVGDDVGRLESLDGQTLVMQTGPTPATAGRDDQEAVYRDLAAGQVTSLDPKTGAELWHRDGALLSVFGTRDLILLTGSSSDPWRIVTVNRANGRDLWSVPAPDGTQWTLTYGDDLAPIDGGLILMGDDGNVIGVDETGGRSPHGRIQPGADLTWAWSDFLGVTRPVPGSAVTDGRPLQRFELHDLRTLGPVPVWSMVFDPANGSPWPCGAKDRLCMMVNDVFTEFDIRTGTPMGRHPDDAPDFVLGGPPNPVGAWNLVGDWNRHGDWLVEVRPALSKTGVGWLGVARMNGTTPQVTALMPLPIQTTSCWSGGSEWVICNGFDASGQFADHSIAIRRSEVDDLIALMRG